MYPRVRGSDETFEQGMRLVWFAVEFRMELAGNEKWMFGQLDDLDELAIRRVTAEDEVRLLKSLTIRIVELVTVTVTFVDDEGSVQARGLSAHDQLAGL